MQPSLTPVGLPLHHGPVFFTHMVAEPPPSRFIAAVAFRSCAKNAPNWSRYIPIDQLGIRPSTTTSITLPCESKPTPVLGFLPHRNDWQVDGATFCPCYTITGRPPMVSSTS